MNIASQTLTIFRREMAAYFNAAIAYIFIIVFVFLNSGLFMTQFFLISRADMRPFFMTLPYLLAVFIPAITMRQWAEERKGNTLELLLTFPMPTHCLVIGKFLAGFLFYCVALLGTFTLPIMLGFLGNPDFGTIVSGYVGALLLGGFFLAIGIFISGICRDQIVAFILSMVICFGLHLLGTEFLAGSIDGWIPGGGTFLRYFVGSAEHYEVFGKGIIDNRDLLYFVLGSGIFLALNIFWLEGRMKRGATKIFSFAAIICAGILILSNWLFASLPLGRFDLTEGRIHTIAPATQEMLHELKSPVTAKFYVSAIDKMPTGMKTLEQDVLDKLEELSIHSGGKFKYKVFHMEAVNISKEEKTEDQETLEDQLKQKGIAPFQVQAVESDEVQVRLVYSGLSLSYKEKPEEIIPRLMPANLFELEYLIASKVYRMTLPEIPKVALVAPYQEKQVEPALRELLSSLGGQIPEGYREDLYEILQLSLEYEGFEVARIKLTEEEPIPEGTSTLVVIEPKMLGPRQKYEINRFLAEGGNVFLSVQNYEYAYDTQGRGLRIYPTDKKPQINDLLRGWGLEVSPDILVDKQHDVIQLSGGARVGPFAVSVPVKVPIQVLVNQEGMNSEVSITSGLSSLFYLWGTSVSLDDSKIDSQTLEVKELIHSSRDSWSVPFKASELTPFDLGKTAQSKNGPFPLAVLAQGAFQDLYAGKELPPWPADEAETPEPEAAAVTEEEKEPEKIEAPMLQPAPGKLIVIGASTLFQKHLVTGGGNLHFFMNSIDALALGEALVTIRAKRPIDRNLGRVTKAKKVGWRFFVTFLVPIGIALIGGFRVFLRKQSKQQYLKSYANEMI